MNNMVLYIGVTDFIAFDISRQISRKWVLGDKFANTRITLLEYNLTFKSLDVYLGDGEMLRLFDVKELIYKPKDAEEEYLSAYKRSVREVEANLLN